MHVLHVHCTLYKRGHLRQYYVHVFKISYHNQLCCGFLFSSVQRRLRLRKGKELIRERIRNKVPRFTHVYCMVFSGINVHVHVLYMYIEYYFKKFVKHVFKLVDALFQLHPSLCCSLFDDVLFYLFLLSNNLNNFIII